MDEYGSATSGKRLKTGGASRKRDLRFEAKDFASSETLLERSGPQTKIREVLKWLRRNSIRIWSLEMS